MDANEQTPLLEGGSSVPPPPASRTASQQVESGGVDNTNSTQQKDQGGIKDPVWRVNLADRQPNHLALRTGQFCFDDGSLGDFVYVPKNYDVSTASGLDAILLTLGINIAPDLVFEFPQNFGVTPNTNYKDSETYWKIYDKVTKRSAENGYYYSDYWKRDDLKFPNRARDYVQIQTQENRVRHVLNGISEACAQTSSVYLITEPFRGNVFSEMACESAESFGKGSVHSLGLFDCGRFTKVDSTAEKDKRRFSKIKDNSAEEDGANTVPWDDRHDKRRVRIGQEVFKDSDYVVTQGDKPKYAVDISCERTKVEESFYEAFNYHHSFNGLASRCSRRLVFEAKKTRKLFQRTFLTRYPTGYLVAGSSEKELNLGVNYLKAGRPLFILEHTGLASNAMAILVQFGKLLKEGTLTTQKQTNDYLRYMLPPSVELWCQPALTDKIWHDARVMAETFRSLAAHFNPDSYIVFNMKESVNVDSMQDSITKVMSSAFETIPELGGAEKDLAVLTQAYALVKLLSKARATYRLQASFFEVLIRMTVIATVSLTVYQSTLNTEDSHYNTLKTINVVLPLLGSMLFALESSFRPIFKFAALLLAEKRIESEIYRFRTRTTDYRPLSLLGDSKGTRSRGLFAERCQFIVEELAKSDLATGTLFQRFFDGKDDHNVGLWSLRKPDSSQNNVNIDSPSNQLNDVELGSDSSDENSYGKDATPFFPRFSLLHEEPSNTTHIDDDTNACAKPLAPRSDMFYTNEYDFSKDFPGKNKEIEWAGAFYSRSCSFKPDPAFLEEEQEASARIKKLIKKSERQDWSSARNTEYMRADAYIEERLQENAREFYRLLPKLTALNRLFMLLIVLLSSVATALVAFELQQWVPVVITIGSAFEFANTYLQLETRIPNLNASASELTNVLMWWNGLTLIKSRQVSSKDELVDRTEDAIVLQYEKYAGSAVSFAKKRQDAAKNAATPTSSAEGSSLLLNSMKKSI